MAADTMSDASSLSSLLEPPGLSVHLLFIPAVVNALLACDQVFV